MVKCKNYSCFEFNGASLHPSFSIYLFEVTKVKYGTYFYVGMTGDNHYPSARSIMHRLGGHIDLSKRSTQSQMIIAIKKLFNKKREDHLTLKELETLTIKLHYWPIEGFTKWEGEYKDLSKADPKYISYLKARNEVCALENKIILDSVEDNLLNGTSGRDCKKLKPKFQEIYDDVKGLIDNINNKNK